MKLLKNKILLIFLLLPLIISQAAQAANIQIRRRAADARIILPPRGRIGRPIILQVEEAEEDPGRTMSNIEVDSDAEADIQNADKLAEKGEWRKAIEIYQKILSERGKSLVTIQEGVYGSVRQVIYDRLRSMPEAAQVLYSSIYTPEAKKLYERAIGERDITAAAKAARDFAATPVGLPALLLLGTMQMESGDAPGALESWKEYLAEAENITEPERRTLAVKMAAAAAQLQDAKAFENAIKVFGDKGVAAEAGGTKVTTAEELRALYAGKIKAAKVLSLPGDIDFIKWQAVINNAPNRTQPNYQQMPILTYGSQGVIYGDSLLVNSIEGVRKFELATGKTIWAKPRGIQSSQRYYQVFFEPFFCRMNAQEPGLLLTGNYTKLEAFDPDDGSSEWTKRPGSNARNFAFRGGQPRQDSYAKVLVVGNTAYVAKTGAEIELYAMNTQTGDIIWTTGLGGFVDFQNRQIFASQMAFSENSLLFWSEGLVGRCNALTGEIYWLSQYGSDQVGHDPARHRYQTTVAASSEAFFISPVDKQVLVARRISDGSLLWKKSVNFPHSILGVVEPVDGKAAKLLVADTELKCLNARDGSILWTWPLPEEYDGGDCILTEDTLVFATRKGLYIIDITNGSLKNMMPLGNTQPGRVDVLPSDDGYILIGGGYIRALASIARTTAMLQGPAQTPNPHMKIIEARLLKEQGRLAEAAGLFEEAFALTGRPDSSMNRMELIEIYHSLYKRESREDRKKEGFDWMIKAIRASRGTPYICRVGILNQNQENRQHSIKLLTGDVIRGKIDSIEETAVNITDGRRKWRVDAKGIRCIAFGSNIPDVPGTTETLYLTNGDHITCKIESGGPESIIAATKFGKLDVKYGDISHIEFARRGEIPFRINARIKLVNGDVISAAIGAFDGENITVKVPFCGDIILPMSEIYSIASSSATMAASTQTQSGEVQDDVAVQDAVEIEIVE